MSLSSFTADHKDNFLNECILIAAQHLEIIDNGTPISADDLSQLKSKILELSPNVSQKLDNFKIVYNQWYDNIVKKQNTNITQEEIKIIAEKDKARSDLIEACIQYRNSSN